MTATARANVAPTCANPLPRSGERFTEAPDPTCANPFLTSEERVGAPPPGFAHAADVAAASPGANDSHPNAQFLLQALAWGPAHDLYGEQVAGYGAPPHWLARSSRALAGQSAVLRLLKAEAHARACDKPVLDDHTFSNLLFAADSLNDHVADAIEHLVDHARGAA